MSSAPTTRIWQFFGGRICLDFANTLDWRLAPSPQELIEDYAGLLAWSAARSTLANSVLRKLAHRARHDERNAAEVLAAAKKLRVILWKAIDASRQGEPIRTSEFNTWLSVLPAQPPVQRQRSAYQFALDGSDLRQPLWPVLWSWTAVLTSADIFRIGRCEAEGCGWYYVDESPNHTRRWCSSELCGNRERVRRAYLKKTGAKRRRAILACVSTR